jgi:hypothetical protein
MAIFGSSRDERKFEKNFYRAFEFNLRGHGILTDDGICHEEVSQISLQWSINNSLIFAVEETHFIFNEVLAKRLAQECLAKYQLPELQDIEYDRGKRLFLEASD